MKKCPYCGAELLDEQRSFCPLCMKSFIEKETILPYRTIHRGWKVAAGYFLVFGLIFAVIGCIIFAFGKNYVPEPERAPSEPSSSSVFATDITDRTDSLLSDTNPSSDTESTDDSGSKTETEVVTDLNPVTDTDASSTDNITDSSTDTDASSTDNITDSSTDTDASSDDGSDNSSMDAVPNPFPATGTYTANGVTWVYRVPQKRSEYPPESFTPLKMDEVVILTGFKNAASDGIYRIPEEIYGRKVVFLRFEYDDPDVLSFRSYNVRTTAREIHFPATVVGISGVCPMDQCTNLTDFYIKADAFYFPEVVLPDEGTFTIHGPTFCTNGNNQLLGDVMTGYSTATRTINYLPLDEER